jgi:hypothetical protein
MADALVSRGSLASIQRLRRLHKDPHLLVLDFCTQSDGAKVTEERELPLDRIHRMADAMREKMARLDPMTGLPKEEDR